MIIEPPGREAPARAAESAWYSKAGTSLITEEIALSMARSGIMSRQQLNQATGLPMTTIGHKDTNLPRLEAMDIVERVTPKRPFYYSLTDMGNELFLSHIEGKRRRIAGALHALGVAELDHSNPYLQLQTAEESFYHHTKSAVREEAS